MRRLMLLTVLALGATAARAENGLFYLGAGVTSSWLTEYYDATELTFTPARNTSWKAFAGVRPLKWLAVEAEYIDLGGRSAEQPSTSGNTVAHNDISAWGAYAVGFLPVSLPMVDFYGKAGVARWKLNSSITMVPYYPPPGPSSSSTSSTSTVFAWGVGVQAHIKMFGARLEYESFNVNGNADAKVGSLSVFLNF